MRIHDALSPEEMFATAGRVFSTGDAACPSLNLVLIRLWFFWPVSGGDEGFLVLKSAIWVGVGEAGTTLCACIFMTNLPGSDILSSRGLAYRDTFRSIG